MPFKSQAQRRFMYATDPKMAKKWEKETPKGRRLPEKKAEMKKLAKPRWVKQLLSLSPAGRKRVLELATTEREVARLGHGGERIADLVASPRGLEVRKIPLLKDTTALHKGEVETQRGLQRQMEERLKELTGGGGQFAHITRRGPGQRTYYQYAEGPTASAASETELKNVLREIEALKKSPEALATKDALMRANKFTREGGKWVKPPPGTAVDDALTNSLWTKYQGFRNPRALEQRKEKLRLGLMQRVKLDPKTEKTLARLKEEYPGLHDIRGANVVGGRLVDLSPRMGYSTISPNMRPDSSEMFSRATYLGKKLPDRLKKKGKEKLAYALSLEIEKNALSLNLPKLLLQRLLGQPKRVKAMVSRMPRDEAVAFLTGLASPLPGGSIAAWKGYKGVKSLAKYGPPLSNYRKMNIAVERMSKMGSVLAKYAELMGMAASPRNELTQGPTGQGLPGYKKGGPVRKDGYLTDKKGKPYAKVHKGERIVSKKKAVNA